jgi:hypothetical protein
MTLKRLIVILIVLWVLAGIVALILFSVGSSTHIGSL